jgi:spore maturation protein CgeB
MDTPVTLSRLLQGNLVEYLPGDGLGGFDLVLSYTGGIAIDELRNRLSAKRVATLYGWVDPDYYCPVRVRSDFASDISYLGTFAADRQDKLETLFLDPACKLPSKKFLIGGAMYPDVEHWPANVRYLSHVAPPEHAAFYSSSPLTLSVTRGAMAAMGYCPSGRLFEAAACGTAILSDWWTGIDYFFEPGNEILIAESTEDALGVLLKDRAALVTTGARARERAMDCHTAAIRAARLTSLIENPVDDAEGNTSDHLESKLPAMAEGKI